MLGAAPAPWEYHNRSNGSGQSTPYGDGRPPSLDGPSPAPSLYSSVLRSSFDDHLQVVPLRHIPAAMPSGAAVGWVADRFVPGFDHHPTQSFQRQIPQNYEYHSVSDVDALRTMIEKLISDAEQFVAEIHRKDKAMSGLQVTLLALEGRLAESGMHQGAVADRFATLQKMHEDEIQRVLRELDEQTLALQYAQSELYTARKELEEAARRAEDLEYAKSQTLHHAKFRDEALKECDRLRLALSAAEKDNFSLKQELEVTERDLAFAKDQGVALSQMVHQEREINEELRYTGFNQCATC
jgi:hypothetical protein